MTRANHKAPTGKVKKIIEALQGYKEIHHRAKVDAYRKNAWNIRIRVIDPDFKGMDFVDRFDSVWGFLRPLPSEVTTNISYLVLVTPSEARISEIDFENPIRHW